MKIRKCKEEKVDFLRIIVIKCNRLVYKKRGGLMSKDNALILYILNKLEESKVGTTKIIKLLYFFDLINYRKNNKSISNYEYVRYYYGPYSEEIKNNISSLVDEHYLSIDTYVNRFGKDVQSFIITEKIDKNFESEIVSQFKEDEIEMMDNILDDLGGLTASQLGTLTYKTPPLQKIGATQGGREAWEKRLDLSTS